ncbi:MAG: methyl-accepting chemotaxis protein [Desulfococcaceae bacterium]
MKREKAQRKLGKITIILIGASVAIAAAFSLYDYLQSKARLATDFEEMMEPIPVRLANSLGKPLWFLDTEDILNLMELEMTNRKIFGIEVVEADGEKIHAALRRNADWEIVSATEAIRGDFIVRSEPIRFEEKAIGSVRIHFTPRFMEAALDRLAASMIARVLVMSVCLALVLMGVLKLFLVNPIARVVAGLAKVGEGIETASHRVSATGEELTRGTASQASAVEETSASLEQIAAMIRQNAQNVTQANALMNETANVVREAAQAMTELIESMNRITADGEKTRKVVGAIEEIAFQTNLLALNAAVEAARAGEAGAGFAVVAEEVRNLALRSSRAARNTAELIEDSVQGIQSGAALMDNANAAFGRVSEGARKVGDLLAEVTAASQEQSEGIQQVSRAMTDIDKVTQENAAGAEETAAAINEIESLIDHLGGLVRKLATLAGGRSDRPTDSTSPAPSREPTPKSTRKSIGARRPSPRALPRRAESSQPLEISVGGDDFDEF